MDELSCAKALMTALERLTVRFGSKCRWQPEGMELESQRPIQSEFFPGREFSRGFGLLPGREAHNFNLQSPYFFFSFGNDPAQNLETLGQWNVWHKTPSAQSSSWHLQRVENVPLIHLYQCFDPNDQLSIIPLDVYTQWFVAMEDKKPVGKGRFTDLDQGAFLFSQGFTRTPADYLKLLSAVENRLAENGAKHLLFLAPLTLESPKQFGFQRISQLNLQASV